MKIDRIPTGRLGLALLVYVSCLLHTTQATIATSIAEASIPELFVEGVCKDCLRFDGIGAISGGGATTRLLVDYPSDAQSEILDFLFLPNFGASLQIIKVEIGGDACSTDGSETSHMHAEDDLNLQRGYEWWILKEAKKRNPHILTYGLPWAFPGWVNPGAGTPYKDIGKLTNYTLQWVKGAREVHGLEIDYLGIWNERPVNREYVLALRKALDAHGFNNTKLVNNDGGPNDLCRELVNDTEYTENIDILGFHYPDDHGGIWPTCHQLGKTIWSAEESSSYDDLNGAGCWARVIAAHYVINNMTANIMWNLLGSYYHGTNWYATSMLTAVQPWSGYYEYEQMPVVWATAHYTQFTQPGWRFLPVGKGSGELAKGGYYVTLVSPDTKYFTTIVVKISREHAQCTRPGLWKWDTEEENFHLSLDLPAIDDDDQVQTQTWYSNLEDEEPTLFEKLDQHNNGGLSQILSSKSTKTGVRSYKIHLHVSAGGIFTVTNLLQAGKKGTATVRKQPDARFPMPYYDDFNLYACDNCYPLLLSDQMGSFEINFVADGKAATNDETYPQPQEKPQRRALVQTTAGRPITWTGGRIGPLTIIGMTEWEDVKVEVSFRLPDTATLACVASRTTQLWGTGITMCANTTQWYLMYGPAKTTGIDAKATIAHGDLAAPLDQEEWHKISLSTLGNQAEATVDEEVVTEKDLSIRVGDSGFVALGASAYAAVEFGHVNITSMGNWTVPDTTYIPGEDLTVSVGPCTPNGLSTVAERFVVTATWQIKHVASGLCVTASGSKRAGTETSASDLTMQKCKHNDRTQQFWHDYTVLRNGRCLKMENSEGNLCSTRDGRVSLSTKDGKDESCLGAKDAFFKWALYPNTQQLRNTFGYDAAVGGRAQCLKAVQGASGLPSSLDELVLQQ